MKSEKTSPTPKSTSAKNNPAAKSLGIQAKLQIGQPGDKYEREADAIADTVVSSSKPSNSPLKGGIQRKPLVSEIIPKIQTKSESTAETASSSLQGTLNATKGSGSALPDGVRGEMESKIGTDFSQVKIHTGGSAVQMNQELGAQAFAHGNDIYFNSGKFNPSSHEGKHLLAHELVHTVQQRGHSSIINRKKFHGTISWDSISGKKIKKRVYTWSQSEWRKKLKDLWSEESINEVEGFLIVASESGWPIRITSREVLNFLMPLYEIGNHLDLPDAWWPGYPGAHQIKFRKYLKRIITRYQHNLLSHYSKVPSEGTSIKNLSSSGIEGLVNESDESIVIQMITSAGISAFIGLDKLVTALKMKENSKEDIEKKIDAKLEAQLLVRNSGQLIRKTLRGFGKSLESNPSMTLKVVDSMWAFVPALKSIRGAFVSLFKGFLNDSISSFKKNETVEAQIEKINTQFEGRAVMIIKKEKLQGSDHSMVISTINWFKNSQRSTTTQSR